MVIDIRQFYQTFFDESEEHLHHIEQLLLDIDIDSPDFDQLNAVFRAAHSIKGGAATFGFQDISAVTHIFESLLDRLRKKEISLKNEMVDVFLEATDLIKLQLKGHISGEPIDTALADAVTNQLFSLSLSLSTNTTNHLDADEGFGFFDDLSAPSSAEEDDFGFFEPLSDAEKQESAALARPTPNKKHLQIIHDGASIRVGVDKVDQLINLVGELVITEAMLIQGLSKAPADVQEALSERMTLLERNTRSLQEAVMSIRMVPIGYLFSRFPRMVRDLSTQLGKQVELVMHGTEAELDKGLVEGLADPLMHLIRNSIDHGIESPEQRQLAGKLATGKITLSASHQAGSIVVEIADDGAGLNKDRIIEKAKARGIHVPSTVTDDTLWQIISEPGFSTSESVTDISGRGVGMDVVSRNINKLNGQVSVESTPGQGCKISLRLPLTLAILDGMVITLDDSLFVLPLNMMIETMQPRPSDIKSVTGETHLLSTRGEYIPIINLHKLYNTASAIENPCDGMLVVVEAHGKKAALLVDNLIGQQQVVIKSLETNFRKVNGISGATIMGDGTVALILDVPAIIKTT